MDFEKDDIVIGRRLILHIKDRFHFPFLFFAFTRVNISCLFVRSIFEIYIFEECRVVITLTVNVKKSGTSLTILQQCCSGLFLLSNWTLKSHLKLEVALVSTENPRRKGS